MSEVYVFGRGNYWKFKSNSIKKMYQIIGYIDNNKSEEVDTNGIPIYLPQEIVHHKKQIIVMTSSKFFIKMVQQLLELGVEESRIILGCNIPPFFDAAERLIDRIGGRFTIHGGKLFIITGKEEYVIDNKEEYTCFLRKLAVTDSFYSAVRTMPVCPISRNYGAEFGKPIDRYYIEKFLENNQEYIHDDVVEIADLTYTKQYGHSLKKCIALHVEGKDDCIKGNFETGEGIVDGMADCLICTQTVQYIYHLNNAAKNIYKMLKIEGTALITMPFLSQHLEGVNSWNDYWRVTPQCLKRIFAEVFGEENVSVGSFGNIKTAIGFLYGLCCDDIDECDFEYNDKEYPVTVWAICHKKYEEIYE